ncbi:MAG: Na+/H+ antiporter NhaC family protein [Saprospiraceae bacterium]
MEIQSFHKPYRLQLLSKFSLFFVVTLLICPLYSFGQSTAEDVQRTLGWSPTQELTYDGEVQTASALSEKMLASGESGKLFMVTQDGSATLVHASVDGAQRARIKSIPLWVSIVPPLIAILLALLFKEVVTSLFIGILSGAFVAGGMRLDGIYYIFKSVWNVSADFFIRALNDSGHLSVILFSLLIGGMVSIISKNGGMAGVVKKLSVIAKDRMSAQMSTYLLGIAIFFDDYANTLIVGNTMRQVTDRFGVSREKLAYLVDATAAPIASVAFITTWIGAELGYIQSGIEAISDFPISTTPYAIFLESLKYSFYPVMTLIFMFMLIRSKRDFGPMLKAERRASAAFRQNLSKQPASDADGDIMASGIDDDEFTPVVGAPLQARNALLPVLTVIGVTIFGLIDTGMNSAGADLNILSGSYSEIWAALGSDLPNGAGFFRKLGILIGSSDSYVALLWASLSGVLVALVLTLAQKIMSLEKAMESLLHGFGTMLPALVILTLAWSLAAVTEDLHTATFITEALQGNIAPVLLPALIFVLAAFISFSTGSSWSTMAILYPIAIPTTWAVATAAGFDVDHSYALLLNVVSTVLAASVLGDHCSPISDTTILSSLASNCDHLQHVKTQMPYAMTVGAMALSANIITAVFNGGWLLSLVMLVVSVIAFWAIIRYWGKEIDPVETAS